MPLFEPLQHRHLLATARELISSEKPDVAVVVAQMACEVFVEQCFVELFRVENMSALGGAVDELVPSYNIANDKVRNLYVALSGDNLQHQRFWQDYKLAVALRNRVVHAGAKVTKEQARSACRAAESLVDHLSLRMRRNCGPSDAEPSHSVAKE